MARKIMCTHASTIASLLVRAFTQNPEDGLVVHVETYDEAARCMATAQLTRDGAVDLAKDLLRALGAGDVASDLDYLREP